MIKRIIIDLVICAQVLICLISCTGENQDFEITPIKNQATISFVVETDKPYYNGYSDSLVKQVLLTLPGLGKCVFIRRYSDVRIQFMWDSTQSHRGFQLTPEELPGPDKYSIVLTWDADAGISNGYFQGIDFRTEDSLNYTPWEILNEATRVELGEGPLRVTDVTVIPRYSTAAEVSNLLQKDLIGSEINVLWQKEFSAPMEVESRKGKLVYTSENDKGGGIEAWIVEGPGIIDTEDDVIYVRSKIPDPPDPSTGHFNFWCREDMPQSFVAEWEFKPVSEYGLAGVFFSATGENGEDIFDPALPVRDGHYPQYHSGAIASYFLFYYTNRKVNRTTDYSTSWLLKANNISSLGKGEMGIHPRRNEFSKVCLIKDNNRIQFSVNGRVTLDFTDPGNERWGPVLNGGKIGFRQMARTVAAYRKFKVWELK
ncbi:MAG: DUF1961 family protein [candidate division Zixibacteria bacterium]